MHKVSTVESYKIKTLGVLEGASHRIAHQCQYYSTGLSDCGQTIQISPVFCHVSDS